MPALLALLDQHFFADVPGMHARTALIHAWTRVAGTSWQDLYVQATRDALAEELPHLSAYSGATTLTPSQPELETALTADLDAASNLFSMHELNSGAYLTELARAIQAQRLILINGQNLYTDEYRQILLNLFDSAHVRFKRNRRPSRRICRRAASSDAERFDFNRQHRRLFDASIWRHAHESAVNALFRLRRRAVHIAGIRSRRA
ncbi:MAG: hypothetical protein DCC52_18225 [Chloroflexi bacterium]|nr:MAG: hypothetical protein DCC52_18225 [Chloroflexota bacterium]